MRETKNKNDQQTKTMQAQEKKKSQNYKQIKKYFKNRNAFRSQ